MEAPVAFSGLGKLDGLVQDEVHERVEASEDALDSPAAVDLQVDLELGKSQLPISANSRIGKWAAKLNLASVTKLC
jgi:hypothetical protein